MRRQGVGVGTDDAPVAPEQSVAAVLGAHSRGNAVENLTRSQAVGTAGVDPGGAVRYSDEAIEAFKLQGQRRSTSQA